VATLIMQKLTMSYYGMWRCARVGLHVTLFGNYVRAI
jgi:hypothetical protein